jgi:hypothetical protein
MGISHLVLKFIKITINGVIGQRNYFAAEHYFASEQMHTCTIRQTF